MRKVWFITRPERDPKFHGEALEAIKDATVNFSIAWYGNREAHKRYELVLSSRGLKRENISNDGSGGRTWAAMLRTFGYIYLDESGYLRLTKVGQQILDRVKVKVKENISKQILTLQIPNAYFLDSGFRPKYELDFEIRPVRFLIRLVNQSSLNYYITKEEITFFALTAKRDDELFSITNQVLEYRKSSDVDKEEIKRMVANNFEHRKRSDSEARDFTAAHGDVAHTFMMLCDYTGLVDYVRGDALRLPVERSESTSKAIDYYDNRYPFNKRYLISLQRFSENAGLDVDSYKASVFGTLPPASNRAKSMRKVHSLLAAYPVIQGLSVDELTHILVQELTVAEAKRFAVDLHEQTYESLNEDFVESYLFEESDLVFENKTGDILRAIGFKVEMRPKPLGEDVKTEIEILVHIDDETICILDAKNYKVKFNLSANLASHMASEYIQNYEGYDNKSVAFYGYVVANDFGGIRNLRKINEKAKKMNSEIDVSGAMFTAKSLLGFLDYCLDNDLGMEQRISKFVSLFINEGYKNVSEML